MALSATNISLVFEIMGVPENGTLYAASRLASLWGPAAESYNFAPVVTALNAAIAALTASQETRVTALLLDWTNNDLSISELQISRSSSSALGVIVDDSTRADKIRNSLMRIIGFSAPDIVSEISANNRRVVR